jgi:hypothetical protein
MATKRWYLPVLVAVAGAAFWLLLAGPDRVLGIDAGGLGFALALLVAWVSLHAVAVVPRGELEEAASPGEWRAWIGLGFSLLVASYLLANADRIAGAADLRDLGAIGRNVVLLLVAWGVLSFVLERRWRGRVLEDEHDREIVARAAGWGRGATTAAVVGVIVLLALTPPVRLAWATPLAIAHILVFALLWGCICEYAATGLGYWRNRRA